MRGPDDDDVSEASSSRSHACCRDRSSRSAEEKELFVDRAVGTGCQMTSNTSSPLDSFSEWYRGTSNIPKIKSPVVIGFFPRFLQSAAVACGRVMNRDWYPVP